MCLRHTHTETALARTHIHAYTHAHPRHTRTHRIGLGHGETRLCPRDGHAGLAWGSWWVPLKHVQILAGVHFFNNKADFAQKVFEAPVTSTRARVGWVPTPAPRWHVSRVFFPGKPLILLGNRFPPKGTFWQNSDFWIFRICLFPHSENLRTDVHPQIRKETNP